MRRYSQHDIVLNIFHYTLNGLESNSIYSEVDQCGNHNFDMEKLFLFIEVNNDAVQFVDPEESIANTFCFMAMITNLESKWLMKSLGSSEWWMPHHGAQSMLFGCLALLLMLESSIFRSKYSVAFTTNEVFPSVSVHLSSRCCYETA